MKPKSTKMIPAAIPMKAKVEQREPGATPHR